MKSLSEVMKEGEEKFEKFLTEIDKETGVMNHHNIQGSVFFLRSSQESIVEWVRGWAEKRKMLSPKETARLGEFNRGYETALSDLLQELNNKN